MQDTADLQIQYFINLAFSPAGILAVLVLVALAALVVRFPAWKWVCLTILLYVCTLAPASDRTLQRLGNDLAPPLQQLRLYSRPVCAVMLALLLIPTVMSGRGWRSRILLGATLAYFAFESVISARTAYAGYLTRGAFGWALFLMIFLTLGVGLPRWLQDWSSVYAALRCIAFGGALVLAGTCYQLVINRASIIHQGRLFGTTNNPNTVGYITSIALPVVCVLLLRRGEPRPLRIAWGCVAGLFVVFLIWAGSRGGLLVTTVSVVLLFRRQLGKFAVAAVVCGVFAFVGFQLFEESTAGADRLLTLQDTRTSTWQSQLDVFTAYPLMGYRGGEGEAYGQYSENFYLGIAATNGLVGLVPLGVLALLLACTAVRLLRARRVLGPDGILADLFVALLASLAVGAVFEAHLAGNLVFSVLSVYVMLAVAGFLLDAAALSPAYAAEQAALAGGAFYVDEQGRYVPFADQVGAPVYAPAVSAGAYPN